MSKTKQKSAKVRVSKQELDAINDNKIRLSFEIAASYENQNDASDDDFDSVVVPSPTEGLGRTPINVVTVQNRKSMCDSSYGIPVLPCLIEDYYKSDVIKRFLLETAKVGAFTLNLDVKENKYEKFIKKYNNMIEKLDYSDLE